MVETYTINNLGNCDDVIYYAFYNSYSPVGQKWSVYMRVKSTSECFTSGGHGILFPTMDKAVDYCAKLHSGEIDWRFMNRQRDEEWAEEKREMAEKDKAIARDFCLKLRERNLLLDQSYPLLSMFYNFSNDVRVHLEKLGVQQKTAIRGKED